MRLDQLLTLYKISTSVQPAYLSMHDTKWTGSEKKHARHIFDVALQRELTVLMSEFKEMAAKATLPDDIWAISDHLSKRRREIDQKYDFRYSQLIYVFGRLLRENWIEEEELQGLSDEKLAHIHRVATL